MAFKCTKLCLLHHLVTWNGHRKVTAADLLYVLLYILYICNIVIYIYKYIFICIIYIYIIYIYKSLCIFTKVIYILTDIKPQDFNNFKLLAEPADASAGVRLSLSPMLSIQNSVNSINFI